MADSSVSGSQSGRGTSSVKRHGPAAARVRTCSSSGGVAAVRERAAKGPCEFTLLVPQLIAEEAFGDEEARKTIELAVPLLEEAADDEVPAIIGTSDAMLAVERVLVHEQFDEVIVSTLPARVSHWLHIDLPARVQRLGLPVTVVTAKKADRPLSPAP